MLEGTRMPDNYDELTLFQKEVLWLGTLLAYERPENFPLQYWCDKILEISHNIIFEDENIELAVGYGGEYSICYKEQDTGCTGCFYHFFEATDDEVIDSLKVGKILGLDDKNMTLVDYLREKGFPITSEFWTE